MLFHYKLFIVDNNILGSLYNVGWKEGPELENK